MDQKTLERKLQREINAVVDRNSDVFNAVLGVVNASGDFHWIGAAGTAYIDKTDEMKIDTPIFIASITKMYTGAATMILQEQGMLSLDDPISNYLPADLLQGIHRYKGLDYTDQLRVYHLISQTSGLPDYFMDRPRGWKSVFDLLIEEGDFAWDLEKVVDLVKNDLSAKFPPEPKEQESSGKTAYYSDTNYQLLGAVIESVARQSLQEVFAELILEPLELSTTYLHGYRNKQANSSIDPADVYYKTRFMHLDKAMKSFGPDGGMVSNVAESLKFLRYLMEGKLFKNPAVLERMKNFKRMFFPLQYGFGLMKFKLPRIFSPFSPSPELIGHSGATSSFLFYSDSDQLYIGGTLNQIENQGRPFRLMLKIINIVSKALS